MTTIKIHKRMYQRYSLATVTIALLVVFRHTPASRALSAPALTSQPIFPTIRGPDLGRASDF